MTGPKRIMDMANAFYDSQILFTASDLGVFGYLAESPGAVVAELAVALDVDPRAGRLLLDGAVAVGLLIKEGDGYANTPETAAFLVPGQPGDLSRAIRYNRDVYAAWGKLPQFLKMGVPVDKPELHLGEDEGRTRTFVMSMHGRALGIGRAVVPHIDLVGCRQILDVGGGPGTYSVLLAKRFPELQSTVLDLPGVVAVAAELIEQQGVSDRVKVLPGDYHTTAFPDGQDAVLLFGMLHQESPASIIDLLERAYAALRPGGCVYVLDMMTDASHTQPAFSALFALNMALSTQNGWVFSDAELKGWMQSAGFVDFSVSPLPSPMPHWLACAQKKHGQST